MQFSVLIPVYNGERFLSEAIDSALGQKRPANEIVVYDDGSTDASVRIAESYGSRIRLVRGTNGPSGFVNGWNKALACASCDFLSILHQDDVLYPHFLGEVESALLQYPDVRHVFAVCDHIDEHSAAIATFPEMPEHLVRYTFNEYVRAYQQAYGVFPHIHRCPGVVTHRTVFEQDGCRYRSEAGHIADDDFFYRVGQYTDVAGIHVPCAAFRMHSQSATGVLKDLQMSMQLSKDYCYQVMQWGRSEALGRSEKRYFEYWALKYVLRSLVGALKHDEKKLFDETARRFDALKASGLVDRYGRNAVMISSLLFLEKMPGFDRIAAFIYKHV